MSAETFFTGYFVRREAPRRFVLYYRTASGRDQYITVRGTETAARRAGNLPVKKGTPA